MFGHGLCSWTLNNRIELVIGTGCLETSETRSFILLFTLKFAHLPSSLFSRLLPPWWFYYPKYVVCLLGLLVGCSFALLMVCSIISVAH